MSLILDERTVRYGGFWRRLIAFLIDWIIIHIFFSSVYLLSLFELIEDIETFGLYNMPTHMVYYNLFYYNEIPLGVILFQGVVIFLYFCVFEASKLRGTPGKLFLKMQIATSRGRKPSFLRIVWRFLMSVTTLFCLGFLMVIFTKKKKSLADVIAGTLVIHDELVD